MQEEMTIREVMQDPLIRQMMYADGVTLRAMRRLLQHARLCVGSLQT
jgi:hypothetical protein